MALIAMAVHDTVENKRTEYTKKTIQSLCKTVDWSKHRLIIVDNGSCPDTVKFLSEIAEGNVCPGSILFQPRNIGTAEAINHAWYHRSPGEPCIKMDNDVVIHQRGWVEEMEEAIAADANIGIVGLKRKDCWENPAHEDPFYRSELKMLPHKLGEQWRVVEKVNHVMGTCQMYNPDFLDKMGYLYQPGLYGFDDALAAVRCEVAGFYSCFLPHIHIDHIDTGETAYQGWKEKHSWDLMQAFHEKKAYYLLTKDIYYNPFS